MVQLLVSLTIGLCATFLLVTFGQRFKVYGQKSFRRIKEESVPQLGGAGIVIALSLSAIIFDDFALMNFLFIASPIIIGGIIDDFKELSARSKFLFQFFSAGLLITLNFEENIWNVWGQHPIITSILSTFFILALCNAVNFIDGLDGLVFAYFLSVLPAIHLLDNNLSGSASIIIGAILAFGYFNKKPAKIYLGDVGSNLIGLILAYSFLTHKPNQGGWHFILLGYLMIFSLPLIDITTSTIRRTLSGSSPFKADKDHIHHRLLKVGLNDNQVAVVFFMVGALCSNVGWILVNDFPVLLKWSNLFASTGVLLVLLYLVFRTEGQLGRHISHFGRTLLENYVDIDLSGNDLKEWEMKRAVVIDLFNYFKELQREGLPRIITFVKDISGFLTFKYKGAKIILISSYSLAIISPDKEKWSAEEIERDNIDFCKLTDKHRVTRIKNNKPEGLYYYDRNKFIAFYSQFKQKSKKDLSLVS